MRRGPGSDAAASAVSREASRERNRRELRRTISREGPEAELSPQPPWGPGAAAGTSSAFSGGALGSSSVRRSRVGSVGGGFGGGEAPRLADNLRSMQETQDATGVPRGLINPLKLKAIAAKLRRRVHCEVLGRLRGGPAYAKLDVDGTGAEPEVHGRACVALASIFFHPLSVLLIAFPLAVVAHVREWSAVNTFWLSILAMVPLAKILGDGTEELAAAVRNDTISGLLNATLGNAVELILSIQTLRKGLLQVVKATLLGSILSNILLVLGTSFFLGGLSGSSSKVGRYHVIWDEESAPSRCTFEKEQLFSSRSALVSMAMQLLATMVCAMPTVFAAASGGPWEVGSPEQVLMVQVSRFSAIMIMCSYVAYILFQLVTHKRTLQLEEGDAAPDGDEEEEGGGLSAWGAVALMSVATLLIAVCSEILVSTIEEVVAHSSLSASFIGIILLPFAGNACEHVSAVRFAVQDRPGLAIGIAVGSSTQIALFAVPFSVLMGWALGQPMDLVFGTLNTAVMLSSVLVTTTLVIDGRSNWLKGFMLLTAYAFTALLYWSDVSNGDGHRRRSPTG